LRRARVWAVVPLGLLTIAAAWEVIASLAYCALTNRMALWVWPYDQWWLVLGAFHANWLMPILIIGSGIMATLPFLLAAIMTFRLRTGGRKLYGDAGFATEQDRRRNGIRTDKSLV